MAEPVTLDNYIAHLQRLRRVFGGDVEVTLRGSSFDPVNDPKLVQVVDTKWGTKMGGGRYGDNRRSVLCLNY